MKKALAILICCMSSMIGKSQKVGIGTNTPEMAVEMKSADSAAFQLSRSTPLEENTSMGLYLKHGDWYTGALRSIGTSSNAARLGLFTYASTDHGILKERISITDAGHVGINNTQPTTQLHVSGTQIIRNDAPYNFPALDVFSTVTGAYVPAINVRAQSTGIIAGTYASTGAGILAWNGQEPALQPGSAITAHSVNGNAIYAHSIKANGFSILANSSQSTVTAGRFQNSGGGKALVTSGAVQIEGLGAGAGKVLTSDAAGNATWQNAGTGVAFVGYLSDAFMLSPGSTFPVSGITAVENAGNALNSNAGEFTAPTAGFYQFTVNTMLVMPTAEMRFALDILRNGGSAVGSTNVFHVMPGGSGHFDTRSVTQLYRLAAGDRISFRYRHLSGTGSINLFGGTPATTVTMFYGVQM